MKTMEEVTTDFITNATWLTDADEPMVAAMFMAARGLDNAKGRVPTTLLAEYRALYNELKPEVAKKAVDVTITDELDAFMADVLG